MGHNALHDETKDARWPVDRIGIDRLRLQPTIERLFTSWKPATLGKGDFLIDSALVMGLTALILAGRWEECHRTLGLLLGVEGTSVQEVDKRPLAKAASR